MCQVQFENFIKKKTFRKKIHILYVFINGFFFVVVLLSAIKYFPPGLTHEYTKQRFIYFVIGMYFCVQRGMVGARKAMIEVIKPTLKVKLLAFE
jgi:hypothetical protein